MNQADLIAITEAIDALDKERYAMGPAWNVAHELVVGHEGEAFFDRLHALLHRIEGDHSNASYWYGQAGVDEFDGDARAEAKALLKELEEA